MKNSMMIELHNYEKIPKNDDKDIKEETVGVIEHVNHAITVFDGLELVDDYKPNEEINEPALRTFRVVAPYGLPGGYKLEVKSVEDGTYLYVVIPSPGVCRGEEFIAEEFVCSPIRGHWSDSIMNCCTCSEGVIMFICACCCPYVAWASVMDSLGLDWCASPNDTKNKPNEISTFAIITVIGMLGVFYCFHPLLDIITIFFIFVATRTRMFVRKKYNIKGNFIMDCCCNIYCNCCSVLQIFRHMKRSGEHPMSFDMSEDVEADIVGSFI